MRSFFVVTPSKEKLVLNERMKIHLFSQRLGTGSLLRLEIISKIKKIIDLKEKTFEEESLKKLPNKNKRKEKLLDKQKQKLKVQKLYHKLDCIGTVQQGDFRTGEN